MQCDLIAHLYSALTKVTAESQSIRFSITPLAVFNFEYSTVVCLDVWLRFVVSLRIRNLKYLSLESIRVPVLIIAQSKSWFALLGILLQPALFSISFDLKFDLIFALQEGVVASSLLNLQSQSQGRSLFSSVFTTLRSKLQVYALHIKASSRPKLVWCRLDQVTKRKFSGFFFEWLLELSMMVTLSRYFVR